MAIMAIMAIMAGVLVQRFLPSLFTRHGLDIDPLDFLCQLDASQLGINPL